MNEKRKIHSDYINNKFLTPEKEKADELACAIKFLLQQTKLPSDVASALYKMLRQLEDDKTGNPKKILRSIAAKIERIEQEYTQKQPR